MANKKISEKDRLNRKATRLGAAIGAVLMPIFFYLVSSTPEMTDQKLMWLCINGVLSGAVVGGGLGHLLTS